MTHLEGPKLTQMQRKFVELLVSGMTKTQAAKSAGYGSPQVVGSQMMKNPVIQAGLRAERAKYEAASLMTKKRVIDGLIEAIDIGRTMAEPASMVAGWREVAKICGYYAPETKNVNLSLEGAIAVTQIENMSDEELVKLVIEGQSERIANDAEPVLEDATAATPLLAAPADDDGRESDNDPE